MFFRIFFLLLFLSFSLFGMERSNPASPSLLAQGLIIKEGILSARGGYGQTIIWDERVKDGLKDAQFLLQLPRLRGDSQDFSVILNIKERVDLIFQSGMLSLYPSFFVGGILHKFTTKQTPYLSVGGNTALIEFSHFTIGVSGQAVFYYSHVKDWQENKHPIQREGMRFSIKQWQITPAFAMRISLFSPYIGVCCRFFRAQMKSFLPPLPQRLKLKGRHKTGIVLGSSLIAKKAIFLNLEVNWIHERSLFFGGQLRF